MAPKNSNVPALRVNAIVPFTGRRAPESADPITYQGEAEGDPDWDRLPEEARRILERNGIGTSPSAASYVSQPVVRRDKTGAERVSMLAWRLEGDRLWVLEAARPAEGDGKLRRGKGQWAVRLAAVDACTIQRATMHPVPLPERDDNGRVGATPPLPASYRGRVPDVWANLPARVRDAVDAAVAPATARDEHGAARLWYVGTSAGTQIIEKLWYDRHGRGALTGVHMSRSVPSALDEMDADVMRQVVLDAPWDVVAFRAQIEWRSGVTLNPKGKTPLPEGIGKAALPPG